jgi:hypothetical protein
LREGGLESDAAGPRIPLIDRGCGTLKTGADDRPCTASQSRFRTSGG